jgi:hypothetical protein
VLQAYSIIKEIRDNDKREQFVFYNGMFAEKKDYEKLRAWAAETNFYGRWMPEHSGAIDYHWNEYPWADSYIRLDEDDDETFNEGGCDMKLAYESQLQEDYKGMKDEHHFLSTV